MSATMLMLKLTRRAAIIETMECAKQIVRSYGSEQFSEADREGLIRAMDHFAKTAK